MTKLLFCIIHVLRYFDKIHGAKDDVDEVRATNEPRNRVA